MRRAGAIKEDPSTSYRTVRMWEVQFAFQGNTVTIHLPDLPETRNSIQILYRNYSQLQYKILCSTDVERSWNVMAHGDARERKWRGNWRMEWVASTLHTTSQHGVSSINTADAHTSAASGRPNWRPCRFKWTRPFRRKTKSGFCACAITFQTQSTVGSVYCIH
jgi:hypothetical protein